MVALFNRFDKDHSGKIVFDEFASFFALMGSGTNKNINPVFKLAREPPADVLGKVQGEILKRGEFGARGLAIVLRRTDKHKNGILDRAEFAWALKENGHYLSKFELDKLYAYFDKNCDDKIVYEEFLKLIRGDLSEKRRALVRDVYTKLARASKGGRVTLEDLRLLHDASKHYAVATGGKRAEDVTKELLIQLDISRKDGSVLPEDFEGLYRDVGGCITSDELFADNILRAWKIK